MLPVSGNLYFEYEVLLPRNGKVCITKQLDNYQVYATFTPPPTISPPKFYPLPYSDSEYSDSESEYSDSASEYSDSDRTGS